MSPVTKDGRHKARGTTHRFFENTKQVVVGDAPAYNPPSVSELPTCDQSYRTAVPFTESLNLDHYIPAGDHLAVKYDHINNSLNLILPDLENPFSETVRTAIEKSPKWMQNDLIHIFFLLQSSFREKWAAVILEAVDPYVDEIAFCIAHLSPQYLMSPYASAQLLKDNATLIYQNDPFLDYVQVVDYGSSQSDPGYYSTTKYRKAILFDTLEVELPRDIYYWYIVHPKITDEIPGYIDPDVIESNSSHSNNITSPENGRFWREFLFYHHDTGYAALKDMLKGSKVLWNPYSGSVVSGVAPAMDILRRWLDRSMEFTSNDERPHQPVRIYRKHIGRCGENGDLRVAIARAALIPAANVASYSTDHVWNEFWDEQWIHWDDGINDPYMYLGDDWNKKFGTVFQWRSDGYLVPVTQRYTRQHSVIFIYALDSNGLPIDGARIILYTTGNDGELWFDTYGVTDNTGKAVFIVGTERMYYAKMQSEYGNVPPGNGDKLMRVVSNSVAGQEYSVSMPATSERPVSTCEEIPVPRFSDNRYCLKAEFKLPAQILRGTDLFDDLNENAYQFIRQPGGQTDLMIMDKSNYQKYSVGDSFQAFHVVSKTDSDIVVFEYPGDSDWYCVFDNSNSLFTLQHLLGTVKLYSEYEPALPEMAILQNFPNPFYPQKENTQIRYQLREKTPVELTIYNILGQRIRSLVSETLYAGEYSTEWNARDDRDQWVSSGVYFCRFETKNGTAMRRMLVLY